MENLLSSPARHETSASRALLRHVVLLAEMISDLHQPGDISGWLGLATVRHRRSREIPRRRCSGSPESTTPPERRDGP